RSCSRFPLVKVAVSSLNSSPSSAFFIAGTIRRSSSRSCCSTVFFSSLTFFKNPSSSFGICSSSASRFSTSFRSFTLGTRSLVSLCFLRIGTNPDAKWKPPFHDVHEIEQSIDEWQQFELEQFGANDRLNEDTRRALIL